MKPYLPLILAAAALCAAGCNTLPGQPTMRHQPDGPLTLSPGETTIITIKVDDRHGIVQRVTGEVAGVDTDSRVTLLDDGVFEEEGPRADEKASDGIWSTRVTVPLNIPEGEETVLFTCFRGDGLPVEVRDDAGKIVPLQIALPVRVQFPGA